MRWSERQRAMLAAMGVSPWPPAADEAPVVPAPDHPPTTARERAPDPAPVAAPAAAPTPKPAPIVREPAPPAAARPGLGPRPVGVEAMDWPALRSAVEGCRACKLCQSRRQTVFGVGHPRAQWMVVGEAPGEQEDQQGEPFVGKSGQLLDQMLRAVGLTRAEAEPARQVYIANSIKCRPPGNRNPEPEELAQCEPFLIRQVALVQPRIILAMGRFAVQSLLRSSEPIGRLRGRVHHYQGVPLIVTYHPAYLLRNPQDKARSWDDLCLALETAAASG